MLAYGYPVTGAEVGFPGPGTGWDGGVVAGFLPPGGDAALATDRQFHRAILEATGNEALISLSGSVGAAVQWTTHFKQRARKTPRDPLPEHAALYEAIAAKDAASARETMILLLGFAFNDMERT